MIIQYLDGFLNYNVSNPIILVCLSFILGLLVVLLTMKPTDYTVSMRRSMILLSPLACAALLAVNGSIGTSIAIMGVFGLVRFRSMEGSSKDIIQVFLAMVIGLLCSTGLVFVSVALVAILTIIIYLTCLFISENAQTCYLKITSSETTIFSDVLNNVLNKYFQSIKLTKIKTNDIDSLYELHYSVVPKENINTKEMLKEIKNCQCNATISYYQAQIGQML